MAKAPENKVFEEVQTIGSIQRYANPDTGSQAEYRVRIIRAPNEPHLRLDIREYLDSQRYQGYTSRGISLIPEQVVSLEKLMKPAYSALLSALGKEKDGGNKKSPDKAGSARKRKA